MATSSGQLSKRLVVWVVALASTAEAAFQCVDYAMDQNVSKTILWASGAVLVFALGWIGERVKVSGGE